MSDEKPNDDNFYMPPPLPEQYPPVFIVPPPMEAELANPPRKPRGGARPGAGRKPILPSRIEVTVSLSGDLYNRIKRIAKDDIPISLLLRETIATSLDNARAIAEKSRKAK